MRICRHNTLEAACYREVRRSPSPTRTKSIGDFPRSLPRRRLQPRRLRRSERPLQPGEADCGLRRHARRRGRGQDRAGSAPDREGGADHPVRRSARSPGGNADLPAPSVRDRGHGLVHPRQHQAKATLNRMRRTFIEGDPAALLCVELYADDERESPLRSTPWSATWRRAAPRWAWPG